jgi:copper chaperone CopZ
MGNVTGCGCGCGSDSNKDLTIETRSTPEPTDLNANTVTLKIDGMTCGHCVASVTGELREVPGVSNVEIDLAAGGTSTAIVTTNAPVENSVLEAAVAEAGYTPVSVSA